MNGKELLRAMLHGYFLITTGVVFSMYIFCLILAPDASFSLSDIGRILLMAFASDLPYVLYYSRRELSRKQMLVRQGLHLVALIAVLLFFAHLWEWIDIHNTMQVTIFLVLVLVIYVVIFAITVYRDNKLAERLNEKLKERNQL